MNYKKICSSLVYIYCLGVPFVFGKLDVVNKQVALSDDYCIELEITKKNGGVKKRIITHVWIGEYNTRKCLMLHEEFLRPMVGPKTYGTFKDTVILNSQPIVIRKKNSNHNDVFHEKSRKDLIAKAIKEAANSGTFSLKKIHCKNVQSLELVKKPDVIKSASGASGANEGESEMWVLVSYEDPPILAGTDSDDEEEAQSATSMTNKK